MKNSKETALRIAVILIGLLMMMYGFMGIASASEEVCLAPKSTCNDLTKAQEDCVVKRRCNAEIRKYLKKIKELEDENDNLKNRVVMLETENNLEEQLRALHEKPKDVTKKNRINILVGDGPLGNIKGSVNNVETERGLILGAQYLRDDCIFGLGCGIQIQTNETVLGTLGFDF